MAFTAGQKLRASELNLAVDRPVMRLSRVAGISVATGFSDNFGWDARNDPTGMVEGAGPTWTFVTVPRDGYYQVNIGVDFQTVGTYRMGIILQTVGQPISSGSAAVLGRIGYHAGSGGDLGVSASDIVPLTAGQRLRCGAFQDSGANANIAGVVPYGTTYWSMAWQRPL